MAGITDKDRKFFPLRNTDAVVNLFREHLENREEPNLALLSIILGALECNLTVSRSPVCRQRCDSSALDMSSEPSDVPCTEGVVLKSEVAIPALQLSIVEALYEQFVTMVKGSVDLSSHNSKYTSVSLLKSVSDVIWGMLTRTFYKDKAHIQTTYSLLTECKLDGFGMAISVIAACQALNLNDVHLALSEDHAWAVFGDPSSLEKAEITWHGKGSEDRRGQLIGSCADKSWLYTTPVICSREMEVAAMVTAINTAINATTDSLDMAVLQQKLFWLLYDLGHLNKYPAALATLADLEEVNPTADRPTSLTLYMKSVESARLHYNNMHVYPYTYLGNYYYRRSSFKQALRSWAEASAVISRYNYNREDEEIYKEFLEIANEMIPNIMKTVSGEAISGTGDPLMVVSSFASDVPLVSDPECYAYLLKFYDGLCLWEEGSSTPVLHITWATHALYSLNRFDIHARTNLMLRSDNVSDGSRFKDDSTPSSGRSSKTKRTTEDDAVKQRSGTSRRSSMQADSETETDSSYRTSAITGKSLETFSFSSETPDAIDTFGESEKICIALHSVKMMGMKELLVAERLNSGAIKLQLTAQSQVHFKQNRNASLVAEPPSNTDNVITTEVTKKRLRRD